MRPRFRVLAIACVPFAAGAVAGVAAGFPAVLARDPGPPPQFGLDEDFTIRMASAVRPARIGPDTVRIRTAGGSEARGTLVAGSFLVDPAHDRRVVVRPEAVREYFQIVHGLDRLTATRQADRTLRALERTGNLRPLDRIEAGLREALGTASGAGVRLDDSAVSAAVPPHGTAVGALGTLRRLVAGDDEKWDRFLAASEFGAFEDLERNPDWERFHHPVDPVAGTPDTRSVYRRREHRRVVLRRSTQTITFAPDVPTRTDLSDAAYDTGQTYLVAIRRSVGVGRSLTRPLASAPLRFRAGTVAFATGGAGDDFIAPEIPVPARTAGPRVVAVTPPNGETAVEPTTDWEDPDNVLHVPLHARRTFTVRLRFAHPIHPGDATPENFAVTRTARAVGTPAETVVSEPVAIGVFLAQRRLGEVLVEITPQLDLDPASRYEVRVRSGVRNLSGESSALDFVAAFTTR